MPDKLEKRIEKLETEIVELKKRTLDVKDLMRLMELIAETRKYVPYPIYPQPFHPPYYPTWNIYQTGTTTTNALPTDPVRWLNLKSYNPNTAGSEAIYG